MAQTIYRCHICHSEILGSSPQDRAARVCLLCRLSAEEAAGAAEEQVAPAPCERHHLLPGLHPSSRVNPLS